MTDIILVNMEIQTFLNTWCLLLLLQMNEQTNFEVKVSLIYYRAAAFLVQYILVQQ